MSEPKFLLDEHYPPSLAENLRARGIDAEAVVALDNLRGSEDQEVLVAARNEQRIVVTADVTTFPAAISAVPNHAGVIFCDSQRFPRTVNALPRLANALAAFATNPPTTVSLPNFIWWLQEDSNQ